MLIKNHVFLITGAGSGLGAATAQMIIENQGKVLIVDLNETAGNDLAQKLGIHAKFVKADVTDEQSAKNALTVAVNMGELRGLINCAGIAPAQKVVGKEGPHDFVTFTRTIQVNLIGSFNMIRLAADIMSKLPPLESDERGVIINTASVAAYDGQIGQAAYAASKGGIVAMTLPIARELARFGIRVMSIAPGIMQTPMLMSFPQEVQDSLGKTVPFPARMGYPSEYAALVQQIITNSYLNGETIRLDGAIRMTAK
jgi:NAD(P)-dependent dehydrogenase (short-subunit alcohol dehydrogenase family)